MLSRPDFLEKQIVVITAEQLKWLTLKNDNVMVYENKKIINQLSCSKVFCIFIIGDCTITTKLISRLCEYQISVYLFTDSLYPKCIIGSQLEGNYVLREKQYHPAVDNLIFAKQLVKNKITNQWKLLKCIRNKDDACKEAIKQLAQAQITVNTAPTADSLRGVEGNASKLFFPNYFKTVGRQRRAPRTKEDVINMLLDIWYSYLYRFIEANLNLYGFDVYKGVYHTLFFERKSLVCDLVEPWRCIIDRKIRKIYNLWQVKDKDFGFKQWTYYFKDWDIRRYYSKLLLEEIIAYKMQIFDYVKSYYQAQMKGSAILPLFYIDEMFE